MTDDKTWPKLDTEKLITEQPMATPFKIGDFTKFVFPVIRPDPNKKPEPPIDLSKYNPKVPAELRCPGCCGPVVLNFFDGYDYGPGYKRGDYHSITCGKLYPKSRCTDVGPHGSLAYIDVADKRDLQTALDEKFAKDQVALDEELVEFKASGAESVTFTRGCGTRVTYVPAGRKPATTHGVDCKCVKPT